MGLCLCMTLLLTGFSLLPLYNVLMGWIVVQPVFGHHNSGAFRLQSERPHISILSLVNFFWLKKRVTPYILREGPWDTKLNRNSLQKIYWWSLYFFHQKLHQTQRVYLNPCFCNELIKTWSDELLLETVFLVCILDCTCSKLLLVPPRRN